ncbi:LuxR C-terminal-related transcriptional regulator [Arthrobacter sp. AL12]|uniref:LuxR C-terminal-related transcriptional regulator n=1 Tax=Arthrobacter sp. AL12 TaxID=3042241 RepID=UPI002499FB55|nr:LuxR C-terminal-related transcriptional regulator [Arthrobacter sp. AL12]MDI3212452.1 LuxR C-terminal-related transcriptional regulator [Arthrobacter sp. AL12]
MESLTESATLVGRSGVVKDIVKCLRDGGTAGALIVGNPGTGKTAVSRAVIRELRPHTAVIRLSATPALSAVPFGALSPYLGELPAHDLDSFSAVVKAMTDSIKSQPSKPLFVIDDAQCLDHGTTQLVAQAVATGAASILAFSRPGLLIPEEFLALWDDGLVAKFDLEPLTRTEVHQLCEQVLRADVSPWASALFAEASAGNPYMLLSLIEHARTTGALALRHGTWFLISTPGLADIPVADLIGHELRSMSPEERTAAAIVALAGPLPLGQLLGFGGPKAVDALERAGIITVSRGADRTVRPASPLIGEIMRRWVPAGKSAGLRASFVSLHPGGPVPPDAFLNRVRWALDCGAAVPPEELLKAACTANAALDARSALRTAEAISDDAKLPEARLQMAYARYLLGDRQQSANFLRLAEPMPNENARYLAALLSARLTARTTTPGNRVAIDRSRATAAGPDTAGAGTAGTGAQGGGSAGTPAAAIPAVPADVGLPPTGQGAFPSDAGSGPSWLDLAAVAQAARSAGSRPNRNQLNGGQEDREGGLSRLIVAAGERPEIKIPAESLLAELLCAKGRVVDGLGLAREAWQGARSASLALPLMYEDLLVRYSLSLNWAGEWEALAAALDEYEADFPSRLLLSGGILHLMRGLARVRQGRMPEGIAELVLGVEDLTIADPWELLPFAHAVAAYAASVVGHPREAEEHATAFRLSRYRGPGALPLLAEAYSTAAGGAPGGAADVSKRLGGLAEEARRQGLRGVETDIRRLAVRRGDTAAADGLARSSLAVEGREAGMLHDYALAVLHADDAELVRISDKALRAGYVLLALEAAQQAERCLAETTDKRKLLAVQRKIQNRMTAAGMAAHIDLVRPEQDAELTARETEILDLVSAGATNSEIAKRLCVSQRTVEGHLYRVFAKLGVSRRVDLIDTGGHSHRP